MGYRPARDRDGYWNYIPKQEQYSKKPPHDCHDYLPWAGPDHIELGSLVQCTCGLWYFKSKSVDGFGLGCPYWSKVRWWHRKKKIAIRKTETYSTYKRVGYESTTVTPEKRKS